MTKVCDFPHPIYGLTKIPYSIQDLTLKSTPFFQTWLLIEIFSASPAQYITLLSAKLT